VTISISLETLITLLTALAGGICWLHRELSKINDKLEKLVTHDLCSERRERCPCVIQMHQLEKEVRDLEKE